MTPDQHAARIGELAAELSMAIRNAAKDDCRFEVTVVAVGLAGTDRRIPRVNVKVI